MIIILTKKPKESFFDLSFYKSEIKYFLKKKIQGVRGPGAVIQNLVSGLRKNNTDFLIDPSIKKIPLGSKLCVIRDVQALNVAIKLKQHDPTKKIFAGPNIVVTPDENNFILFSPLIDRIIVPSKWVKDFYSTFEYQGNKLEDKIKIWPVGVCVPIDKFINREICLIYKKNCPEKLFEEIVEFLKKEKIKTEILEYGKFNQKTYLELLKKSYFMIYLQEIESQGLALLESWSYDVPTLVWNNHRYFYPNKKYSVSGNISAPYLTNQSGLYFEDSIDFKNKLYTFIKDINNFSAKDYVFNNLSQEKSAENFLKLIKNNG
ncbi:hypothetical protein M0P65_06590 [Candidatus Gracilibacteria bacterium]|nr:hypothetical protein [Candidatus Gracilibacteria bacterium]